ncbi:MAG TPA: hypothetical protein VIM21_11050 [Gemmatimonadaceae bacterium]
MQKEADFQIGRPEVIVKLAGGELAQLEPCFGFHDKLAVHDHVDALDTKLLSFVSDPSPDFPPT